MKKVLLIDNNVGTVLFESLDEMIVVNASHLTQHIHHFESEEVCGELVDTLRYHRTASILKDDIPLAHSARVLSQHHIRCERIDADAGKVLRLHFSFGWIVRNHIHCIRFTDEM
jgi:hypothetical protein